MSSLPCSQELFEWNSSYEPFCMNSFIETAPYDIQAFRMPVLMSFFKYQNANIQNDNNLFVNRCLV